MTKPLEARAVVRLLEEYWQPRSDPPSWPFLGSLLEGVDPVGARHIMEELIARVAARAGIPADQASRAINLVLAFLKKEAPEPFQDLEQHMPEAESAAAAGAADKPSGGGIMGGLMGMMSGGGGLMALAGQLTGIGLGTGEMTSVGKEIFAFCREKAGDERVDEVAAAIPGLSQFL